VGKEVHRKKSTVPFSCTGRLRSSPFGATSSKRVSSLEPAGGRSVRLPAATRSGSTRRVWGRPSHNARQGALPLRTPGSPLQGRAGHEPVHERADSDRELDSQGDHQFAARLRGWGEAGEQPERQAPHRHARRTCRPMCRTAWRPFSRRTATRPPHRPRPRPRSRRSPRRSFRSAPFQASKGLWPSAHLGYTSAPGRLESTPFGEDRADRLASGAHGLPTRAFSARRNVPRHGIRCFPLELRALSP
jgi:hypothetical protein